MKICDLCGQVVLHLESGPDNCEPLDVCEGCRHDLIRRLQEMEQWLAQRRQEQRHEVITTWRRERKPPDGQQTV